MDPVDLYDRASAWMASLIPAAQQKLDAKTPCDEWTVRDLLNHLIGGHKVFVEGARGGDVSPPAPGEIPAPVMSDDPASQFEQGRKDVISAFREEGVLPDKMQLLGIAFVDTLTHGWDIAKATGQDTTMPEGLGDAAYEMFAGNLPPERRGHLFKPAIAVADDASAQDRLIAYLGRDPNS